MSENPRRQSLRDLYAELEHLESEDHDTRATAQEMRDYLQQAIDTDEHHSTLAERLEAAFTRFEVDHPKIAAAIRSAVDQLSASGV
ncbi:MAG: DUF4404 family protein [bacterium]|nr:DUF4404 family protein [bacterium]